MIFAKSQPPAGADQESPAIPGGLRVYAVGDIHGRDDLLDILARGVEADLAIAPPRVVTIFLGDYIDRGLGSAQVLERLRRGDFPTELIALRGNHEQALLDAFNDPKAFAFWRKFGGLETLASYGVDIAELRLGRGVESVREAMREKIPASHVAFLESLPLSHEIGDFFFCHAGVKPGRPLARQVGADLMWIRDEFLRSGKFHGKVIVHGHTPIEEPQFLPNRINLDTGAYQTGRLTCLVLEGRERRLLGA